MESRIFEIASKVNENTYLILDSGKKKIPTSVKLNLDIYHVQSHNILYGYIYMLN
jgi:hypothetical protein